MTLSRGDCQPARALIRLYCTEREFINFIPYKASLRAWVYALTSNSRAREKAAPFVLLSGSRSSWPICLSLANRILSVLFYDTLIAVGLTRVRRVVMYLWGFR